MSNRQLVIRDSVDETGMADWTRFDIITSGADFTLEVLANQLERKEMVPPEFQRPYVWKQPKASGLIESFLRGLPIPPIYLYQRGKDILVIDGLQRLLTVYYFLRGYFPVYSSRRPGGKGSADLLIPASKEGFRPFRLILGEANPYDGMTFNKLPEDDKTTLRNSALKSYLLRQLSPENDTSIYYVFQRLNTGGMVLSEQEIRTALYYGKFKESLTIMNEEESWRQIIGTTKPDLRGRDLELILRILAVAFASSTYKSKPFGGFLSGFMARYRSSQRVNIFHRAFTQACQAIIEDFGERPFHQQGRSLNPSLLDAICGAYILNLKSERKGITKRFAALLADKDFSTSITNATTDPPVVRLRLDRAESILFRK